MKYYTAILSVLLIGSTLMTKASTSTGVAATGCSLHIFSDNETQAQIAWNNARRKVVKACLNKGYFNHIIYDSWNYPGITTPTFCVRIFADCQ